MTLQAATSTRLAHGRNYEEQYQWLLERRDPASSLEARFLDELHKARHRLPDKAQYRPESQVYAEADFFYDRGGLKGIAVFVDGSHHDEPSRRVEKQLAKMGHSASTWRTYLPECFPLPPPIPSLES
jgi:hypothetical protein